MAKHPTVKLTIVLGVEGRAVYLNDFRIAGPKPWGGGKTEQEWNVRVDEIKTALKLTEGA